MRTALLLFPLILVGCPNGDAPVTPPDLDASGGDVGFADAGPKPDAGIPDSGPPTRCTAMNGEWAADYRELLDGTCGPRLPETIRFVGSYPELPHYCAIMDFSESPDRCQVMFSATCKHYKLTHSISRNDEISSKGQMTLSDGNCVSTYLTRWTKNKTVDPIQ